MISFRRTSWLKLADKKGLPKISKLEKRLPCKNDVHKMGAEADDEILFTKMLV